DYDVMNKGELTSRQNGYVGGYIGGSMTKKLVKMAEQQMEGDKSIKQ
ncbi:MAG TPA: small, acid-soluble spore protein, alpha/beta type, partial [Syntrophomonas sp.]|nr:small, acid-soluble spore protein, alpha/beta type [Syntrophomonas sp.]